MIRVCDLFDRCELNYWGKFICYSGYDEKKILFRSLNKKYEKYKFKRVIRCWVSMEKDKSKCKDASMGYATLCFAVDPIFEDLPKDLQEKRKQLQEDCKGA